MASAVRRAGQQQVDKLSEQELRPQFVEELKTLISQVYKNARPKRLYNQNLNGSSTCLRPLLTACTSYVEGLTAAGPRQKFS